MALTTSNVIQTDVQAFMEGLAAVNDWYAPVYKKFTDNTGALRRAAFTGVPSVGTWDGTSDVTTASISTPASNAGLTLTYAKFAIQVKIPRYELLDVPGIQAQSAQKLGMSVASKYAELAGTNMAGILDGNTEALPDTKKVLSATHTMTSGTRSNALTSALDRASFLSAIRMAREWQNYQTQITDWAKLPKFLVVPAELEGVALQIVGSSVTSDQNQMNTAGLYNTKVVVCPYLTDASDWGVFVDPNAGFSQNMAHWDRSAPRFQTAMDQDDLHWKHTVDFATIFDAGPLPDGIIGSTVA